MLEFRDVAWLGLSKRTVSGSWSQIQILQARVRLHRNVCRARWLNFVDAFGCCPGFGGHFIHRAAMLLRIGLNCNLYLSGLLHGMGGVIVDQMWRFFS